MKVEKTEYSYQVTECDLKFGEEITLDGEVLIPVSLLDKVRTEMEDKIELSLGVYNSAYREGMDEAIKIIDKYRAKSKDTELQATDFLAEARECAEREVDYAEREEA